MYKLYTVTESATDDAITLSQGDVRISIALQEYAEEEYHKFLTALDAWNLLYITDDWEEEGIETGDYRRIDNGDTIATLPLKPDNILIKNNEVIGFVLGRKHYPKWKISDNTVLMFIDGTSLGRTEHECSYVWGDYPSDTVVYHHYYAYKLEKKSSLD